MSFSGLTADPPKSAGGRRKSDNDYWHGSNMDLCSGVRICHCPMGAARYAAVVSVVCNSNMQPRKCCLGRHCTDLKGIISHRGEADKPLTRRRVREKGEKDGRNAEESERAVEQCGLHGLLTNRDAPGGAEAHGTAPGATGAGRCV